MWLSLGVYSQGLTNPLSFGQNMNNLIDVHLSFKMPVFRVCFVKVYSVEYNLSRIYKLNAFTGSCTQKFLSKKNLLSMRFMIKNVWRPMVSTVVWLNSQPAFFVMIRCEKENKNYSSFYLCYPWGVMGEMGRGGGRSQMRVRNLLLMALLCDQ